MSALFANGLNQMGLVLSDEAQEKCLQYIALLEKWNKVFNLTAIREVEKMVVLHLLDSLSVLPYIQSGNLLDVGSGGGIPGIILAIAKPELKVTTIDTVQKKAIFMRQVKGELNLSNLEVIHGRVENYQPVTKFNQVISRAFSEIDLFMSLTRHLITPDGEWLAMKGQVLKDEIAKCTQQPSKIIPLTVAGLEAERHLIVYENK